MKAFCNEDSAKEERITKKCQYVKAVLHPPLVAKTHTAGREHQHKAREMAKTLFGYYRNGTRDLPL